MSGVEQAASRSPRRASRPCARRSSELEGPRRDEMAARIKVAREEGDLKENAEYHIAKEDQAHLETRIKRLRERLHNAVVVEVDDGAADVFAFGRTAEVLDEASRARSTPGPWSARPRPTSPPAGSPPSRRSAAPCLTPSRRAGRGRDPEGVAHLRRPEAGRLSALSAGRRGDLDRLAAGQPVGLGRGRGVAQVPLGVEGAHAAGAGGGDRLAVGVVDDVADGEDAGQVGPGRAGLGDDVAVLVGVDLALDDLRAGDVADRDEGAVGLDVLGLAGLGVAQPDVVELAVLAGDELLGDERAS